MEFRFYHHGGYRVTIVTSDRLSDEQLTALKGIAIREVSRVEPPPDAVYEHAIQIRHLSGFGSEKIEHIVPLLLQKVTPA